MLKVTKLSAQKKNPDRFNLFLDGKFYCGVDLETISRFNLHVDQELSEADVEKIFESSEISKLYHKILDFIAVRPRSRQEIDQRLREKIYRSKNKIENQDEVIESIIQRLERVGYLDETEFVRWWIRQRIEKLKPSGFVRIKSELRQKGIRTDLINKIWSDEGLNETELLSTHYENIKDKYDITDRKDKNRLVSYLRRQGFRWDEIRTLF